VYAERADDGRGRAFRRGFSLRRGERIAVVDDILSTGGSLQETIAAATGAGAMVACAAVLADRSGGASFGGLPYLALWKLEIATFTAEDCPQCAAGTAPRKPGTTPAVVPPP